MLQLNFTVPAANLEKVKEAIFKKGAGKFGNYSHCAWQTEGQGQFKPLPGSDPEIGKQGELTYVKEYQVQTICEEKYIEAVIIALKASHPYEVPSYQVIKLESY